MKLSGYLKTIFFFIALVMAAIISGCSQQPPAQPKQSGPSPDNVRSSKDVVKAGSSNATIPAGGSAEAVVSLSISTGYHINANPATFDYLIATEIKPKTVAGISADKPAYPPAEKKKFAFAEEPLAVYEGEIQIKLPLRADSKANGSIAVPVDVRVQACDQEKCFPPDTLHLTISAEVK